jgi:hypothetical protein
MMLSISSDIFRFLSLETELATFVRSWKETSQRISRDSNSMIENCDAERTSGDCAARITKPATDAATAHRRKTAVCRQAVAKYLL